MTTHEQLQQDLDYIAGAVRRQDRPAGDPAIFFLWALLVPIGFALPDFAPRLAGAYWFVFGTAGGLLSMWLGARAARRRGIRDADLGRRYVRHWAIGAVAFVLAVLPLATGAVPAPLAAANYLLLAGLLYALAGIHLQGGLLASGLMMFAAYAALMLFRLPYTWTLTGVAIAIALAWAGFSARRACDAGAAA